MKSIVTGKTVHSALYMHGFCIYRFTNCGPKTFEKNCICTEHVHSSLCHKAKKITLNIYRAFTSYKALKIIQRWFKVYGHAKTLCKYHIFLYKRLEHLQTLAVGGVGRININGLILSAVSGIHGGWGRILGKPPLQKSMECCVASGHLSPTGLVILCVLSSMCTFPYSSSTMLYYNCLFVSQL
jgi:hypothetical protein